MDNKKIKEILQENSMFIVVFLICIGYMATAIVNIDATGKSLVKIICDGAFAFIISYLVVSAMGMQGILLGRKSNEYMLAVKEHRLAVRKCRPKMRQLNPWCSEENKRADMEVKTLILSNAGLDYDKFIENGYKKEKLTFMQRKAIRKVKHLKLTKLSAGQLMSDIVNGDDPNYLGISQKKYLITRNRTSLISKSALMILFGYLGVTPVLFNWEDLLFKTFQAIIFVFVGCLEMWRNMNYMRNDCCELIKNKVSKLNEFYNDTSNEPSIDITAEMQEDELNLIDKEDKNEQLQLQ